MAQTTDDDLKDQYYTNVSTTTETSLKTNSTTTPPTYQWYCIKAVGASTSADKFLQGGIASVTDAPTTGDAKAVDQAEKFFRVIKNTSGDGYYIKSGNGYYLQMTYSNSNYYINWTKDVNSATYFTYNSYYNIRITTALSKDKDKYGFLQSSESGIQAYKADKDVTSLQNNKTYQFYFLPVTFVTKYTVTYKFQYTEDGESKTLTSTELVQKDKNPTYTTEDGLNGLLQSISSTVYDNYQVDTSNSFPTFNAVTGDITYTINLKSRVTLIDQTLTYNTPVEVFEGETRDLDNFIITKEDGATITYSIKSGNDYITISGSKITGVAKGSAVVTATSAAFNKFNAATIEIPIKVTGYTDAQKAFIAAYDALAAYKDNIGIRLGQYTYKKSSTSTNDNAEFTDMIFDYINQRNDVRSYTDRDLQSATTAITALTSDIQTSGKLSLNLPTPGTLLRMKASGSTSYIAPTPPTGSTYTDILYYYDPSSKTTETTTIGSLVSYDTGYHVQSMAVANAIGDGTDYTFTAMTPTATDGLYKANDLTTSYILEDVDSLPVVIREYGYATLYTPAALQIPNAIKAYIATAQSGTNITLSRIRGIVPSGTALVLVGAAGTYQFPVDRTTTDAAPTSPLKGTYPVITTASVGSSVYALQPYTPDGASSYSNVAFYLYDKSVSGKENITHFKCYFTSTSGAKLFTVTFDDNGIDSIEQLSAPVFCDQSQNSTIYDLQGRRITTPAAALPRGIYIIGGRKVVIK